MEPTFECLEKAECTIESIVIGNPTPIISWFKNKTALTESDNILFEANHSHGLYKCIIKSCELADAGTYMIKAKNTVGEATSTTQVSIMAIPKIIKKLAVSGANTSLLKNLCNENTIYLIEKSPLKVDCQIQGTPKPTITLLKNNLEIKQDERIKVEVKQNDYSIVFKNVTLDDSGEYEVKAENSSGFAITKIQIEVCSLPTLTQKLVDAEVIVGDNTKHEFVCTYRGKPKPDVNWLLNDKPLAENAFYTIINDDLDNGDAFRTTLKIDKIDFDVAGQYKCCIKNSVGEVLTSGNLSVLKSPLLIEKLPERIEVVEGKEIKLKCVLDGDCAPIPTATWFKEQSALVASKKVLLPKPVIDKEANTITYSITVAESSSIDCGTYTVKLSNKAETIESSCIVEVISSPKIVKDLKKNTECSQGESVCLEVHASGKPIPSFKWFHIDRETNAEVEVLDRDGEIISSCVDNKVYSLLLKNVSNIDCGTYILRLSNNAGKVETSANILVNCKL